MIRSKDGFTLIELLLAITILTIVVLGLFPLFEYAHTVIMNNGNKAESLYSLQNDIIDKIVSPDKDDLTSVDEITFNKNDGSGSHQTSSIDVYDESVTRNYFTRQGDKSVSLYYYVMGDS
ncbi:MAG: prepilin-type N-terminal cleavage/methylation domain-containing protein [Halanaerobiales bacterium]|nr:prepilin-type N-terminal cleavage/methylation domain-containing protein [Halanaerobiales bacterium]